MKVDEPAGSPVPDDAHNATTGVRHAFHVGRFALLSGSTYAQLAIAFITLAVVARTLGLAGLGFVSLALAGNLYGTALVDFTLGTAVGADALRPQGGRALRRKFIGFRFTTMACLSALLTPCVLQTGSLALRMVALGLLAGGLYGLGDGWLLLAGSRMGSYSVSEVSGRLLYFGAALALVRPGAPVETVPIAMGLGSITTVALSYFLSRGIRSQLEPGSSHSMRALARLGGPMLVARLMAYAYGQGAPVVFASFVSPVQLGLYAASDRIVRGLQSLLYPLATSMYPRFVEARWGTREHLRKTVTQGTRASIAVALALLACTLLLAPIGMQILYGQGFGDGVPVLRTEAALLVFFAASNLLVANVLVVHHDSRGVLLVSLVGLCGLAVGLLALRIAPNAETIAFTVVGVEACALLAALGRYVRLLRRRGSQPSSPLDSVTGFV